MRNIINIKTIGDLESLLRSVSEKLTSDEKNNVKTHVAKLLGFNSYGEAYRAVYKKQKEEDISKPIKNIIEEMRAIDATFSDDEVKLYLIKLFNLDLKSIDISDVGLFSFKGSKDSIFISFKKNNKKEMLVLGTSVGMYALYLLPESIEIKLYTMIVLKLNEKNHCEITKKNVKAFRTENNFDLLQSILYNFIS